MMDYGLDIVIDGVVLGLNGLNGYVNGFNVDVEKCCWLIVIGWWIKLERMISCVG